MITTLRRPGPFGGVQPAESASYDTDHLLALLPDTSSAHVAVNTGPFADSYIEPDTLRSAANLGVYPNPFGPAATHPPPRPTSHASPSRCWRTRAPTPGTATSPLVRPCSALTT